MTTNPKFGEYALSTYNFGTKCRFGRCPVCNHPMWVETKGVSYCNGVTNQERYKHQKSGNVYFAYEQADWSFSCSKSKRVA